MFPPEERETDREHAIQDRRESAIQVARANTFVSFGCPQTVLPSTSGVSPGGEPLRTIEDFG